MTSDKITSLERNRYFFGKLLTANDFNVEQDYFNNKRRLINRLNFGTGVACGMEVIKADDTSIAVESGLAFDSTGREIVLPHSIVKKLSSIEGFNTLDRDEDENIKSVYLCAGYIEECVDPVHSVAKDVMSDENDGSEYNRIRESCKLYLTSAVPSEHPFEPYCAAKVYIPIWSGDGVEISLTAPRYVLPCEEFFLETCVKKSSSKQQVSFDFEAELAFLTAEGKHTAGVSFYENEGAEGIDEYAIRTPICAASLNGAVARIAIKNVNVSINDFKRKVVCEKDAEIIITKDKEFRAAEFLRKRNLEEHLFNRPSLYLARLNLILTSGFYIIDKVESLPFGQKVLTGMQSESLRLSKASPVPANTKVTEAKETEPEKEYRMSSGSISVQIPSNCVKGGKYFSKSVPHFLGAGEVLVNAAFTDNQEAFFGDIFDNNIIWGIKTDKERGLFTIGVKLKKTLPECELMFDWYAFKKNEQKFLVQKMLSIYPNVYYAKAYETIAFETKLSEGELVQNDLVWSVVPEAGGRITKKGIFTASSRAGFYEIRVKSRDGKLSATAFVVI